MKKTLPRTVIMLGALSAAIGMAVPAISFADTGATAQANGSTAAHARFGPGLGMRMHIGDGIRGSVTAISGSTLTVSARTFERNHLAGQDAEANTNANATVTYTVNAANATVKKDNADATFADITVGDKVMVQGTKDGTTVTATTVIILGTKSDTPKEKPEPIIQGNGQPVVAGKITAISDSTITITNASNVSYTVDASSATIAKGNTKSDIAGLSVGDQIVVQGAVNGSSITAASVIEGKAAASNESGSNGKSRGFFGVFAGIGGFFAHLFGF